MRELSFTIYGEPKGKGRPRFARTGAMVRTYTPAETVSYENLVKLSYLDHYGKMPPLLGPLEAIIVCFFPVPKSESKKRQTDMLEGRIRHTKKIDCDNLAKAILDALNGIAYGDDKQICKLSVEKRYGTMPRTEVTIAELQ